VHPKQQITLRFQNRRLAAMARGRTDRKTKRGKDVSARGKGNLPAQSNKDSRGQSAKPARRPEQSPGGGSITGKEALRIKTATLDLSIGRCVVAAIVMAFLARSATVDWKAIMDVLRRLW
jgi:hypothetical protein